MEPQEKAYVEWLRSQALVIDPSSREYLTDVRCDEDTATISKHIVFDEIQTRINDFVESCYWVVREQSYLVISGPGFMRLVNPYTYEDMDVDSAEFASNVHDLNFLGATWKYKSIAQIEPIGIVYDFEGNETERCRARLLDKIPPRCGILLRDNNYLGGLKLNCG
jgi:hypothetical protein